MLIIYFRHISLFRQSSTQFIQNASKIHKTQKNYIHVQQLECFYMSYLISETLNWRDGIGYFDHWQFLTITRAPRQMNVKAHCRISLLTLHSWFVDERVLFTKRFFLFSRSWLNSQLYWIQKTKIKTRAVATLRYKAAFANLLLERMPFVKFPTGFQTGWTWGRKEEGWVKKGRENT